MSTSKKKPENAPYTRHRKPSFFSFMKEVEEQLCQNGQFKTATSYHCTQTSFKRFLNESDIPITAINAELIQSYERWLKESNISLNTISYYMRILRATYNKAADKGYVSQKFPFKNVYTGIEKTRKRAIGPDIIHKLINMDLKDSKSLEYARDLFLFSFFTRGMSFVDMAHLRKQDLNNGFIHYNRRKTGQRICVKVEPCMMTIIRKYKLLTANSSFLLPILRGENPRDIQHQYYNAIRYYNTQLRRITAKLNLPVPLTSYVSRHTWATIAKSKEIPISVISEGMGHTSIKTTQIYLASLEQSILDKANEKILSDFLTIRF